MDRKQISCSLHDHVEVICMFHYKIRVFSDDESIYEGEAKDIISKQKKEYLLLLQNNTSKEIALENICKIEVLTANARISHIDFK